MARALRQPYPAEFRSKIVDLVRAGLNPVFTVEGKSVIMATTDIAGVPVAALGSKVTNLAQHASDIIGAVDFLLTGA